jgi:hypothetical protein
MSTNLFQLDVEQLIPVVLARAGYEKRLIESGAAVEEAFLILVKTVEDGIAMVREGISGIMLQIALAHLV